MDSDGKIGFVPVLSADGSHISEEKNSIDARECTSGADNDAHNEAGNGEEGSHAANNNARESKEDRYITGSGSGVGGSENGSEDGRSGEGEHASEVKEKPRSNVMLQLRALAHLHKRGVISPMDRRYVLVTRCSTIQSHTGPLLTHCLQHH